MNNTISQTKKIKIQISILEELLVEPHKLYAEFLKTKRLEKKIEELKKKLIR